MVSPFPGMDPYLEQSAFWGSFHSRMIVAIADAVAPLILPKYYIEVETRIDVSSDVKERYLEACKVGTDTVVTTIELLSANLNGMEDRRQELLDLGVHVIEIDLLRRDAPMPILPGSGRGFANIGDGDGWLYRILVSRCEERPIADLYGFNLQDAIPRIPLPLRSEDQEPVIDLQAIFEGIYERSGYEFRLNYRDALPLPLLSEEELRSVDGLLGAWR
jgi:Protein of unknown function (DUF4058)